MNKFEIPGNIIDQTKSCTKEFKCLSPECIECRVEETMMDDDILFIKEKEVACHYKLNFGDMVVCACPVRQVIYEKYKV